MWPFGLLFKAVEVSTLGTIRRQISLVQMLGMEPLSAVCHPHPGPMLGIDPVETELQFCQ